VANDEVWRFYRLKDRIFTAGALVGLWKVVFYFSRKIFVFSINPDSTLERRGYTLKVTDNNVNGYCQWPRVFLIWFLETIDNCFPVGR